MGQIYEKANRTLIYIGADDEGHAQIANSLVDDVAKMIDDTLEKIEKDWDSFPFPEKSNPLIKDFR